MVRMLCICVNHDHAKVIELILDILFQIIIISIFV